MDSTLGSFSRSVASPTAFSVSLYPSDWSLFEGGDPAPGHPFEWISVAAMWRGKAEGFDAALSSFQATGQVQGQGYQVRFVNDSLGRGQDFVAAVQAELFRMGELAQGWSDALVGWQDRAQSAHRLATEAKEQIDALSAKISFVSSELELLEDLGEAEKEDARAQLRGLRVQYSDAVRTLADQRELVRGIAEEYRASASAMSELYVLQPAGDLISQVVNGRGGFSFSLLSAVGQGLFAPSADSFRGQAPVSAERLAELAKGADKDAKALEEYLSALALLSPSEIADFAAAYPDLARLPLPVSGQGKDNALAVRDWWNADGAKASGLTPQQREAFVAQMPGFVGNLEGVRYSDRDRANRVLLDFFLAHPELTSEHAKKTLKRIEWALTYEQNDVPRSLINLDLSNMELGWATEKNHVHPNDSVATDDVLMSLAFGDLDAADAVTFVNPGMSNHPYVSLDPNDGDMAGMGQSIYLDQAKAYSKDSLPVEHAVIINLNYITPQDYLDVLSMEDARRASDRNANAVDAFNVLGNSLSFENQNRKVYLWNHSYGSTTAGETIRKVETPIEAYFNVGAAGWSNYYLLNNDAASLQYLAKDEQGRPQMYSALASADDTAKAGMFFSGRTDPREFYNSFEVSAERSADGLGLAVEGHFLHPQTGVGYNTPGSTSYREGIWITTDQVHRIHEEDIRFRPEARPRPSSGPSPEPPHTHHND